MVHTGAVGHGAVRRLRRLAGGVPILMYHLVSDRAPATFHSYTVSPAAFRRQVATITRLGFRSVTMDDLATARAGGSRLPRRPVVITFDDGFRDCLRYAAPVLHDAGLTATMYVVAGLLGDTSRWMAAQGVDLPLLTRTELMDLEQAGVRCESHALTHPRLASLSTSKVSHELTASRRVLEDALGRPVRHLAYPHGSQDARVRAAAREAGYVSACTTRPGKALPEDDDFALPRAKVDGRDGTTDFVSRLLTSKESGYAMRRLTGRTRKEDGPVEPSQLCAGGPDATAP